MSTSSDRAYDTEERIMLLKIANSKSGNLDTSIVSEGTKKLSYGYSNRDIVNTEE